MQVSGKGAAVGALVGMVARGAVVLLNFGLGADRLAMVAVPSAAIGALVGAIAGASGRPIRGAVIGAILSGVVFELFMLSCASVVGTFSQPAGTNVMVSTLTLALEMAVAGAIAGYAGGAAGERPETPPSNDKPTGP